MQHLIDDAFTTFHKSTKAMAFSLVPSISRHVLGLPPSLSCMHKATCSICPPPAADEPTPHETKSSHTLHSHLDLVSYSSILSFHACMVPKGKGSLLATSLPWAPSCSCFHLPFWPVHHHLCLACKHQINYNSNEPFIFLSFLLFFLYIIAHTKERAKGGSKRRKVVESTWKKYRMAVAV